jgi:A/G-specific adenine glycosylase
VQALAAAREHDVLKQWEGLGYYRRARHLHQAAQIVVAEHGGIIPREPSAFAALPGVGKYIVGAVLSQAFEQRLPILEANTRRLLCRLSAETADPKDSAVERRLWLHAQAILPRTKIGDFNQALMELGALVCTPTQPKCGECPLQPACRAHQSNQQATIPRRTPPVVPEAVREVCVVPYHAGRVLLLRRGPQGRWANMWEFPRLELRARETLPQALTRLQTAHELHGTTPRPLTTIHYAVTRFRIEMHCFLLGCTQATYALGEHTEGTWLALGDLATYPVSTAQRKLAQRLRERPPTLTLEAHS